MSAGRALEGRMGGWGGAKGSADDFAFQISDIGGGDATNVHTVISPATQLRKHILILCRQSCLLDD